VDEHEIDCSVPGKQDPTFACRHILEGLTDRRACGFWFDATEEDRRPDAWCDECNAHLVAFGGKRTDEAQAACQIALLCGKCYDDAKMLNGNGRSHAV
jgi:hypothetical protein